MDAVRVQINQVDDLFITNSGYRRVSAFVHEPARWDHGQMPAHPKKKKRKLCKSRSKWKEVISAYPYGKRTYVFVIYA
jgi:hypothetical protein